MIDYSLDKGSIWEVAYFSFKPGTISDSEKQAFIDRQSREYLEMFNPKPGLSKEEYSALFVAHFLDSRRKSEDILNSFKNIVRTKLLIQVGNSECLSDISKIEASSDFVKWENPELINLFKGL